MWSICRIRTTSYNMLVLFFQAEDGIRDTSVTGVQTCALPICGLLGDLLGRSRCRVDVSGLRHSWDGREGHFRGGRVSVAQRRVAEREATEGIHATRDRKSVV